MTRFVWFAAAGIGTAALAADDPKPAGWRPDPQVQAGLEKKKVPWLYREEGVPKYVLPDPLVCADGSRVTTAAGWEQKRRPETLDLFRTHVFGRQPAPPTAVTVEVVETDAKALDGAATLKRVKITAKDASGKTFAFEAAVLTPNGAAKPVPAFLLVNNRPVASADPTRRQKDGFWPAERIIERGYAAAVFRTGDVDPDDKTAAARATGVRGVWPAGGGTPGANAWGTIAAWAWGASRVLDYLQRDPAVDGTRVAVVGHSRGGKTALWAAAEDQRFAMAVSNDSGRGGASLSRRRFGETVAAINRSFPHWFCDNYKTFDNKEDELPVDHHQLVGLIAPRAVAVGSADQDLWADPRGEFLAVAHARPVFALYGEAAMKPDEMPPLDVPLVRGKRSYHVRRGGHDLTPSDWERYLDFADGLGWQKRK